MRRYSSLLAFSAFPFLVSACSGEDGTLEAQQPQQTGGVMPPAPGASAGVGPAADMPGVAPPQGSAAAQAPPAQPGAVLAPDSAGEEAFVDEPIDQEAVEAEAICESSSEGTTLQDVVLAFAFDVSGSMGSTDSDRELKWDPIVTATKAFFTDAASQGLLATLTFFPDASAGGGGFGGGDQGDGQSCEATSYQTPDVDITALPSEDFGVAIDGIQPNRRGTPTMAVLQGTIDNVRAMQATAQDPANYAIVLVTDGVPQLCSDEQNDIAAVAAIAGEVAADIPVYVIGVDSPNGFTAGAEDADGLGNLNMIASSGGTGTAFIIDTGNPEQTVADFKVVIEEIRESAFSCNVRIPPAPEGEVFDAGLVNVSYQNDLGVTEFTYDVDCTADFGWRYDNPDAPTVIEMCPTVCEAIKADAQNQGQLNVEFGCEQRVDGVR